VKRAEAARRLDALLERVVRADGRYLVRVREVWVFGSFARGALEVGDVDLAVEFDQTKDEAGRWFATLMAGGFDHLGALRRELRGNQRALEIHFNELDDLRKEGFEPQLLWRRGDSLEEARARLAAVAPNASARRAARDSVHPLLAEVEKLIPRPARQEFSLFMWARWLDAKLVKLPREQAANAITRRRFAEQWSESNPRLRAAHAVASYLEREGVAPLSAGGTLYSDEREIVDAERDYWQPCVAVHFGAKLLQWAMFDFGQGIPRVLVVLNPTARKQTLRTLDMRATVDREEFFAFQHGDGRRRMIERLARGLRRRRAARLHARVRRLAQNTDDADHVLSHRPFRPKRAPLSPEPVPKIQGPSCAIANVFCSSDFGPAGRGHHVESLPRREVLHPIS
jgi:Nucleotidyltransferase domain